MKTLGIAPTVTTSVGEKVVHVMVPEGWACRVIHEEDGKLLCVSGIDAGCCIVRTATAPLPQLPNKPRRGGGAA